MVSEEEIPQYDKEQVKHVKGVLRDSIEMLEQVGLPVLPGDILVSQWLTFLPYAFCLMSTGANWSFHDCLTCPKLEFGT